MVSDTINYFEAQFRFLDECWNGLSKWAHFKQGETVYDFLLENDHILSEQGLNLQEGQWKVYLHGTEEKDGIPITRITTNAVSLGVLPSEMLDGEPLPPLPPTAAEQIEAVAQEAKAIAQSVRSEADVGAFKGEKGEKGDPGDDGTQIDDAFPGKTSTYSSVKIEKLVEGRIQKFFTNNLGETHVTDSDDGYMRNGILSGKSLQDAEPTPDAPQEIKSVENVGMRVTGKNLLNPNDVTTGLYMDDGSLSVNPEFNLYGFIPVSKGETLTLSCKVSNSAIQESLRYVLFDENKMFLGRYFISHYCSESVTIPIEQDGYIRVCINHYCYDVTTGMLEHGSVVTEFEPYTEQSVTIPHTLRGLPVETDGNYTDKNGQQWICDEVDFERGVLVQRIGETVLDGTQTVEIADSGTTEYTRFNYLRIPAKSGVAGWCTHLRPLTTDRTQSLNSMEVHGAMNYIIFRVNVATSVNEWNAWLAANPVTTIYALVTPTETPLSAEEIEAYKALLTHYGGTNIFFESANGVEPNLKFDYPCAMDGFVEYIKEQMGDTRTFVYNMDSRLSDEEYLSALAYVNSEYAAALLELEV